MAKKKDDAAADDIQPVEAEAAPVDPKDAEIAALKAELAAAKAGGPVYAPGKKYKVELKDAGAAIVQPKDGEHPWEAFRRHTGVISSVHQPVITEAGDEAECGHIRPNNVIQPFADPPPIAG